MSSGAILMPYQSRWVSDTSLVKVIEKSRRIGLSYAEAADDVLYAASDSGANVYYISYNKEMTQGFIQDCAAWAKAYQSAASKIEESVIKDGERDILAYAIRFDSGHMIQAFTSNPRNLRSKGRPGERLVIDEAAFVDDIEELLKAAMAMTIWGGKSGSSAPTTVKTTRLIHWSTISARVATITACTALTWTMRWPMVCIAASVRLRGRRGRARTRRRGVCS